MDVKPDLLNRCDAAVASRRGARRSSASILLAALSLGACSASDETATTVQRAPANGAGETETGDGTTPGGEPGSANGQTELDGLVESGGGPVDCGLQLFDVRRLPTDVLLVLDRSASMRDPPSETDPTPKWDLTVPALTQVIQETDSGVSWGMKLFPEGQNTQSCSAATLSDQIHIPIAPANASAVIGAIGATSPDGDGTPTGDAIHAAVRYLSALASDTRKFIVLATDGEPSCSPSGEGQENARPYAVGAVTESVNNGIPVFVVGVATTKDTATQALNAMAVAGGVPRADGNPLASRYYLANTQAELVTALRIITGSIASCVFPLSARPPVPNNIGVKVDGTLVPRDGTRQNGWEYTNDALTAVEVHGSWCNEIQTAAAEGVQVIYACEGVVIQ